MFRFLTTVRSLERSVSALFGPNTKFRANSELRELPALDPCQWPSSQMINKKISGTQYKANPRNEVLNKYQISVSYSIA